MRLYLQAPDSELILFVTGNSTRRATSELGIDVIYSSFCQGGFLVLFFCCCSWGFYLGCYFVLFCFVFLQFNCQTFLLSPFVLLDLLNKHELLYTRSFQSSCTN